LVKKDAGRGYRATGRKLNKSDRIDGLFDSENGKKNIVKQYIKAIERRGRGGGPGYRLKGECTKG